MRIAHNISRPRTESVLRSVLAVVVAGVEELNDAQKFRQRYLVVVVRVGGVWELGVGWWGAECCGQHCDCDTDVLHGGVVPFLLRVFLHTLYQVEALT